MFPVYGACSGEVLFALVQCLGLTDELFYRGLLRGTEEIYGA